ALLVLLALLPLATLLSLLVLLALATLCAILIRALTHSLVQRLQPAHEIARTVGGLRLLALTGAVFRRCLRLSDALREIVDVRADHRLDRVEPVLLRVAHVLLRVPELLLGLSPAERIGRGLQRA